MVRTRTAPVDDDGDIDVDELDLRSRGKRRRSENNLDKDSPSPVRTGASKRRRGEEEQHESSGNQYPFVRRRSERKVLLETQREYELKQSSAKGVYDDDIDSDDAFSRSKGFRRGGHDHDRSRNGYHGLSSRRGRAERIDIFDDEKDDGQSEDGEDDTEVDLSLVRRSQRQRQSHFQSLNMSDISKRVMEKEIEVIMDRRRRHGDAEEDKEEGEEGEEEDEEQEEGEEEEEEEEEKESSDELEVMERGRPGLRPLLRSRKACRQDLKRHPVSENVLGEEGEEEEQQQRRSYFLRENKPVVKRYQAPENSDKKRRHHDNHFSHRSPTRRRQRYRGLSIRSPAKKHSGSHRHHRAHNDSSTTTSGSSSDDEGRFERRKSRSMHKARDRCLPMNFTQDDLRSHTVASDRMRIGASLADIDPMSIDRSTSFDTVGGLEGQVNALKEMVVFPLLYPEVFNKFGIQPPRGVLFHGPPGTGKTLVARALANECGVLATGQQRVAFFMRKGADCLSKWVGESERQLRLLFDQAYNMRPSIIFFDEIDGLAPVRSTRQDQIHSSIVSTLLALMDGLDSRGEVVVIGATNRIDAIDPALRRPGRFDREFRFPLPNQEARKQIIKIHTKAWNPQLSDQFVSMLAERTVGYCGADVKAMCAEVTLCALRRTYPQIYSARDKLVLNLSLIKIESHDFASALEVVVPTTVRCHGKPAWPLQPHLQPLLEAAVKQAKRIVGTVFPPSTEATSASSASPFSLSKTTATSLDSLHDIPMYDKSTTSSATQSRTQPACLFTQPGRPRLLLHGGVDSGLCDHVAPAILHTLERFPVHVLDMSNLFSDTAHSPEHACTQLIREAARTAPSVLYMPRVHLWWCSVSSSVHASIAAQLNNLSPSVQLFVLATAETNDLLSVDEDLVSLFASSPTLHSNRSLLESKGSDTHQPFLASVDRRSAHLVSTPNSEERMSFFKPMLVSWLVKPLPSVVVSTHAEVTPATLPVAPPPEPRQLTVEEQERLLAAEEKHLRELRIFLRDCTSKLLAEKKFKAFSKPVDLEEVTDYLDVIKEPLDLEMVMQRIDSHHYDSAGHWLGDINLIVTNCVEYNPATEHTGKALRHRAFALNDMAASLIDIEMSKKFEARCLEIQESRRKRSHVNKPLAGSRYSSNGRKAPVDHSVRRSLRVHGIQPDSPEDMIKQITSSPSKASAPSESDEDSDQHQRLSAPSDDNLNQSSSPRSFNNSLFDMEVSDASACTPVLRRCQKKSSGTDETPDGSFCDPPPPIPSLLASSMESDTAAGQDTLDSGVGVGEALYGRSSNSSPCASSNDDAAPVGKGQAVLVNGRGSDLSPDGGNTAAATANRRLQFSPDQHSEAVATPSERSPVCEHSGVLLLADPADGLLTSDKVEELIAQLVASTAGYSVSKLEAAHASLSQVVQQSVVNPTHPSVTDVVQAIVDFITGLPCA